MTTPVIPFRVEYDSTRPQTRRLFSLRLTLVCLAIVSALHIAAYSPDLAKQKQIYLNFGLKLPSVTQLTLNFQTFWIEDWGWAIGWTFALVLPLLICLVRPSRPRDRSLERQKWLLAFNIVFFAVTLITGWYIVTVKYMPMENLVDAILR